MHGPIPRLREAPKDVLFFERKDRESSGFSGDRLDPGPEENNVHNGTYTLESGRKITYTTGDWSKITTPRAPIKYKDAAKTFIGFDFLDVRRLWPFAPSTVADRLLTSASTHLCRSLSRAVVGQDRRDRPLAWHHPLDAQGCAAHHL
jgi:hypothetical protein